MTTQTLSYAERNKAYREKMLAKITTHYKGWEIIKRRTVITPVNAPITVLEYVIKKGDYSEATFTMETAKELIDSYEREL